MALTNYCEQQTKHVILSEGYDYTKCFLDRVVRTLSSANFFDQSQVTIPSSVETLPLVG